MGNVYLNGRDISDSEKMIELIDDGMMHIISILWPEWVDIWMKNIMRFNMHISTRGISSESHAQLFQPFTTARGTSHLDNKKIIKISY